MHATKRPMTKHDIDAYLARPNIVRSFAELVARLTAVHQIKPYPKIKLTDREAGTVQLSLAGPKARHPGSMNITDGQPYGANAWYGRISPDGHFTPSPQCVGPVARLLIMFARDPAAVAKAHGELTGNCCFCSRTLTNAGSIEVGYGPICAERYDLPHPTNA